MIDKPPRIALLIDADNSPAAKIGLILNELSTFGETSIRRAYGNWKKQELRGWEELLHEHAIRPMQQFDYSKGKNASDMAMVIDALDLLYSDRPEAFGIVSSDADFTPLVMYLRAKGAAVYGFGGQKTPEPFVNACSRFLYLDKLATLAAGAAVDIDTGEAARDDAAGTPLRVPAPSSSATPSWSTCCATRSRRPRARAAGPASARSASRSATRRRSTRATTATRRSPSCSRRPTCSSSTRKARRTSRCATSGKRAPPRPERSGQEKGGSEEPPWSMR